MINGDNDIDTWLHNEQQLDKAKESFNHFNARSFASMAINEKGEIFLHIQKNIDEQDIANNLRKLAKEFDRKGGSNEH